MSSSSEEMQSNFAGESSGEELSDEEYSAHDRMKLIRRTKKLGSIYLVES